MSAGQKLARKPQSSPDEKISKSNERAVSLLPLDGDSSADATARKESESDQPSDVISSHFSALSSLPLDARKVSRNLSVAVSQKQ